MSLLQLAVAEERKAAAMPALVLNHPETKCLKTLVVEVSAEEEEEEEASQALVETVEAAAVVAGAIKF